jgi:hypothetical protein
MFPEPASGGFNNTAIAAATPTTVLVPNGSVITGFAVTLNAADANALAIVAGNSVINSKFELGAGQESISEVFPQPIPPNPSTGSNSLTVSATATATGFATVWYSPTEAATLILSKDSSSALGGTGFVIMPNVPVVINSRAQLYATNPNLTNIQVSVLAELYGPENES